MVGPNKPRPVKNRSANNTYGASPVGASAYAALQAFDDMPEAINYKAGGCSSCRGGSKNKAPLAVPVTMIIQATLDTATTAPTALAQRDATVLKADARQTRAAGISTMPDAYINQSAMTMAGGQARQAKVVPFNPYHRGSANLHQSAEFQVWATDAQAWLNNETTPAEADLTATADPATENNSDIPSKAKDVIAFLDANPDRIDDVEQAELARSAPRKTVKDKIGQMRAVDN